MQAFQTENIRASKQPRRRLLHGPRWVSPFEVERAAFQRVTRSHPSAFQPSSSVVVIDPETREGVVVDLTAHRSRRHGDAAAHHPSRWQPAR